MTTELKSHFVFGTTAAYSHVPPIIELSLSLLRHTPDLCISVLLHVNHLENSQNIIENEGVSDDVKARIKLWPVGEKREWNDMLNSFMDMIYKSGEVYAGVLIGSAPWPHPAIFIYDAVSFFYVTVKAKVEENFPHLKPTRLVAYNPLPVGEMLFLGGTEENGSLRWLDKTLDDFDPDARVKPENNLLSGANNDQSVDVEAQAAWMSKFVKAYKACLFESDRLIKIPGYTPFHAFERWGTEIDYTSVKEIGWFQYLAGFQACLPVPEMWISCYPSSVLESETFDAIQNDPNFTSGSGGKKEFLELGWFERKPKASWGEGVKEFLNKHGEKSVVYISFGTIVNAGPTLPALFDLLEETKTPYIYACGKQKNSLPQHIKDTLDLSEKEGICVAPDWVDQVGVLSHPSIQAFVSHCGANSTVESIEAGVPIISMGRRDDQSILASRVHAAGLGIELLQHRTGFSVGKEVAHRKGIVIEGTYDTFKAELASALERIRGEEGIQMRKTIKIMGDQIRQKRKAEWEENIKRFGLYGRESTALN
ncbi:uncharacterized protein I303_103569 [Kwoniella dejecticola CBS 10117]|uniref:UDP-glycosyltransferases domain-containing protein n=1 Tax=Kwoniella dejecticola CBS 10117 TaxID=1296121 RepID=A0A1A6A743_9TREE|nr:uncharacterized protein I303_03591 [Kwoniella dejecticola CBS 10117]OBR85877.1 hypothetical protein I303_03591 [Kwoniella dejecticola CBS 10117]